MTGEAASANAETAGNFPDGIKKITEKEYLPEQVFSADENALIWKRWGEKATKDIN